MRILVHDYSGHPFQVELSRALAGRHQVLHVHCASYETGKGSVTRQPGDPASLRIEAIDLGRTFDRYSSTRRLGQELAYGTAFARVAAAYRPDVVLSSNDPLLAKVVSALWCGRSRTPWVFWLQDLYSLAMANYARRRLGAPGRPIGGAFVAVERRLLRHAAAVVAITDDFVPLLDDWRVPADRYHVIENWAPLGELAVGPKDNPWSRAHGLHDRRVLLYSGTLGLKHDPGLLVALAERFRAHHDVRVVVISQGRGADWLAEEVSNRNLGNMVLLPFQPYEQLPEVFATADVLLALLQSDAGVFSVPSKVLTYLCAGRPVLAAMPSTNLGSRTVARAGAGIVVEPGDGAGFVAGAEELLGDARLRATCGASARDYAERRFDIDAVLERFEPILTAAATGSRRRSPDLDPAAEEVLQAPVGSLEEGP